VLPGAPATLQETVELTVAVNQQIERLRQRNRTEAENLDLEALEAYGAYLRERTRGHLQRGGAAYPAPPPPLTAEQERALERRHRRAERASHNALYLETQRKAAKKGKPIPTVPASLAAYDNETCALCLSDEPTHVFIPCGHKCICDKCAKEINPVFSLVLNTNHRDPRRRCCLCRQVVRLFARARLTLADVEQLELQLIDATRPADSGAAVIDGLS